MRNTCKPVFSTMADVSHNPALTRRPAAHRSIPDPLSHASMNRAADARCLVDRAAAFTAPCTIRFASAGGMDFVASVNSLRACAGVMFRVLLVPVVLMLFAPV